MGGIPKGGVAGYTDVSKDNEQALMSAVAQQPVSIAIEADQSSFQFYSSGVLTASWGTSWGEQGYVRLSRGTSRAGECGILSGPPSFPVISGVVSQRVVV